MDLLAEYEIGCERLPFVTVAKAVPSATLEAEMVPSADGPIPFVLSVVDGPAPAVEDAVDATAFVGEYTVLGESNGHHRYKVIPAQSMEAWFDTDFDVTGLRTLAETDAEIDRIRVTPTGWIQRGRFADREVLASFRTFWQAHGSFTIRRLRRKDVSEEVGDGLTDPQRQALVRAHEMGYFEVPRRASLADVAEELDITASSLSERLRRAQEYLIDATVRDETL